MSDSKSFFYEMKERDYACMMHLSQLASCIIPFSGFIIPYFLWKLRRDDNDFIKKQGRAIVNWQVTFTAFIVVGMIIGIILPMLLKIILLLSSHLISIEFILGFKYITNFIIYPSILLITVIGILGLIFPIIGAFKSIKGEYWKYPFSYNYFKESESNHKVTIV